MLSLLLSAPSKSDGVFHDEHLQNTTVDIPKALEELNIAKPVLQDPKEVEEANDLFNGHDQLLKNASSSGEKTVEKDKSHEKTFSQFPIHCLILCTNSDYFKKLFAQSGMKENFQHIVTVKVKHGEGLYLERMIEAFYNSDILSSQDYFDLISLMDIGGRYLCSTFLEHCMAVLETKDIESIEDFDSVFVKLSKISICEGKVKRKLEDFILTCIKNLSEKLYPLEFETDEHDTFIHLNFVTVMHLVVSKYAITLTEDHLLLFMYKWLTYNDEQQTSQNIGDLLENIRISNLNISFICDEIAINDPILCKWEGYPLWFSKLLKYHLLSPEKRAVRDMVIQETETKRLKPQLDKEHPVICEFAYREEKFENDSNDQFIWKGVCITPHISINFGEGNICFIALKFTCKKVFFCDSELKIFYRNFTVLFSLLLNNKCYNTLGESTYEYYRKKKLKFGTDLEHDCGNVAIVSESSLVEMKDSGMILVLYVQGASCCLDSDDMNQVKTSEHFLTDRYMKVAD